MCQAEEMSGKTLEGDSKGRKKKAVGMTSTDIALMTETLGRGMRSRGAPGAETVRGRLGCVSAARHRSMHRSVHARVCNRIPESVDPTDYSSI